MVDSSKGNSMVHSVVTRCTKGDRAAKHNAEPSSNDADLIGAARESVSVLGLGPREIFGGDN